MNYGELKSAVLAETHRADLSSVVADFIRRAEGFIARKLRATEMIEVATLTDSDRVAAESNIYTLPSTLLEVRAIWAPHVSGRVVALTQRSLAELRTMELAHSAVWYGLLSGNRVEIRGNPPADTDIELEYFARPAELTSDTDTNDLLTMHEDLYIAGSCFYLFRYTQDLELAQAHLDSLVDAIDSLNEQAGRELGSPTIRPAYFFGQTYGGY